MKAGEKELCEWLRAAWVARRNCQSKRGLDKLVSYHESRLRALRGGSEDPAIHYRTATKDDGVDIWNVLEDVAPEIPLKLETSDARDALKTEIIYALQSTDTWIAVDFASRVCGVVLARPSFGGSDKAVFCRYIGVPKTHRHQGIFRNLMTKLMAKEVPLAATVLTGNKSAMADRLAKLGFAKTDTTTPEQTTLRWSPPTTTGR
jgi:hypothetical protein